MNRLIPVCLLLVAGCAVEPDEQARTKPALRPHTTRTLILSAELPAVNLPPNARARNRDSGSCVFVSVESCLHWQARDDIAAAMRASCKGGSGQARLHANLDRLGVPYASTSNGDVAFLEWSVRTRRGAMIFFFPNHAVTLVDLTVSEALLLDNNRVQRYIRIPREEFIRRWRGYGGTGTTPLIGPPAPPT